MFIRNTTSLDVSLARGHLSEEVAVAAVVISMALRIDGDRLTPLGEPLPRSETEPPAGIARVPVWHGVSVTAAGHALGPAKAPFVRPVIFRVGAAERRLIVFGDRRWERRAGGALEPPPPVRFDRIALSFERAYGGAYDLPPGLLPGTELPHPGLRVPYPFNERGVGFYADDKAAAGSPLPNIERPDQLVRRWNDRPEPAGFTPCPELVAWRMQGVADAMLGQDAAPADGPPPVLRGLRVHHHAPPPLIFDDVPPGTPLELSGLGDDALRFVVPASPARVTVRAHRTDTAIRPRLRALHVDADRRALRLVLDHSFHYDPRDPPGWIRVATA